MSSCIANQVLYFGFLYCLVLPECFYTVFCADIDLAIDFFKDITPKFKSKRLYAFKGAKVNLSKRNGTDSILSLC